MANFGVLTLQGSKDKLQHQFSSKGIAALHKAVKDGVLLL